MWGGFGHPGPDGVFGIQDLEIGESLWSTFGEVLVLVEGPVSQPVSLWGARAKWATPSFGTRRGEKPSARGRQIWALRGCPEPGGVKWLPRGAAGNTPRAAPVPPSPLRLTRPRRPGQSAPPARSSPRSRQRVRGNAVRSEPLPARPVRHWLPAQGAGRRIRLPIGCWRLRRGGARDTASYWLPGGGAGTGCRF